MSIATQFSRVPSVSTMWMSERIPTRSRTGDAAPPIAACPVPAAAMNAVA